MKLKFGISFLFAAMAKAENESCFRVLDTFGGTDADLEDSGAYKQLSDLTEIEKFDHPEDYTMSGIITCIKGGKIIA